MVKIETRQGFNLTTLALDHYKFINPRLPDNSDFARFSLSKRIESQKAKDVAQNEPHRVLFWDYLLLNSSQKLEELIVSTPRSLQRLIDEINAKFGSIFFSNLIDYKTAQLSPFGNIVAEVFNYKNFRKKNACADTFESIKLTVCPYCNLVHTYVTRNIAGLPPNDKTRKYFQLDHFFPQVRNPYLALSFFNLIPSCYACNASLKGEKDFKLTTHVHPFEISFNDRYLFTLLRPIINESDVDIQIIDIIPGIYRNPINDFDLLNRYNTIGLKKNIFFGYIDYKNRKKKTLSNVLRQIPKLWGSPDAAITDFLNTHGVPTVEQDINILPLGKLKRDLYISFNAI